MKLVSLIGKFNLVDFKVILNLLIRVFVMAIKYIFIVFAYNSLSKKDFVDFSVATSFLNFSILVIGLDLYQITQRKHVNANIKESSILFYSELFTAILFTFISLLVVNFLKNEFIFGIRKIILITFFDFVILSISRLLLVKNSFLLSSLVNSARVIPHLIIIIYFIYFLDKRNTLNAVFDIWYYSLMVTSILILILINKSIVRPVFPNITSIYSLLSFKTFSYWFCSLSTYFLLFIDKKILHFFNLEIAKIATYSFFFSLYSFIPALIDSFLINPNFKLVLQTNSSVELGIRYRDLLLRGIRIVILSIFITFPLVAIFLRFDPSLYDGLFLIIIPIILFSFLSASFIPSTFLYAKHLDKIFFKIHFIQILIFLLVFLLSFVFFNYLIFLIGYSLIFIYITFSKHKHLIKSFR